MEDRRDGQTFGEGLPVESPLSIRCPRWVDLLVPGF